MPLLARAWIGAARARRRWGRTEPAVDPMGLLRSEARGHSVVDVGCMWGVDGAYAPAAGGVRAIGVTEPFDAREGYGNWWWGITPSALRAMLRAAGFALDELRLEPFLATAIARPA